MSLLRAASLIAILSLVSKGVGLLRDMVFAYYCGLSVVTDAYNTAYLIPGSFALLMLGGLNGPFHSAVVSTLTRPWQDEDRETYETVLDTTLVFTFLLMGTIALLLYFAAPGIIGLWKTLSPETAQLATLQLQIMAPMFLLSGLIGISYGVLNIRQSFFTPSLSPIMASLTIILALIFFSSPNGLSLSRALAWGTLIGAVCQLLLQMIPLLRSFRPRGLRLNFRHPLFHALLRLLFPAVLSSTVGQVNLFVIYFFAGAADKGISAFQLGNRLLQLPLGILLTALLVPLLPVLSSAAQENDHFESLKTRLNQGLRPVILITLPVTLMLIFWGPFLIAFLFEKGRFTAEDTALTHQVLLFLSLSICFYAVRDLLIRVFYALQDSRVPFLTTFVSILGMFVFSALFAPGMGVAGVSLAASLSTGLNFIVLSFLLKRRIGSWFESASWKHLGRVLLGCIPLILGGWACLTGLPSLPKLWQTVGTFLALSLLSGAYLGILILLRDPEVGHVLGMITRRFRRRPTDSV
ncbi:murein biosynthesis integral membrane protein MurJ [bacterium (Candidatus Blackallbacteria) CG17_big_fil_post_rev_8_21_14_2_50_48_46]|uniref:Probable lipid II flippase MurJ n=1 Tax=bacterium (Candidatus Blackallbacteria) CG17_big_fil_post_rev_8_21_14_2_50_48_46 TaxID=2014261 RepID=A0A2M7FZ53_9BACT|nr:MAG: murein biosynthesis integral membrane protein MurJ [bacterium (Candidatus Blackallbacteria) CG18_big_fil_WC_8_21_14_2_50_49_26]PIW14515.1 MAG: murein biosynthesis integral membrane protein MurJ [bacterium (Candidatus Blackallbacteria) CG17_big_fil_post_rev_8_21_14_2_50_48_46]PIW47200.1 MAG: murein biosynthesis integral membrane protein MurJ [bacterium (Candidatus Blackallbacteria) CG13_big_fil_rev_8_21_14_2_50_49_14]